MASALFFAVAFLALAVLVYAARYSGRLRVEERRLMDAPVAEVYARVADLREWCEWAPWLEHEPAGQVVVADPPGGKGGRYVWRTGAGAGGEVVHVALLPGKRIEQNIRCLRPLPFWGRSEWTFSDCQGKAEVTWRVRGRVRFSLRPFTSTVEKSIALDCRFGLDRLARLVEAADGAARPGDYSLSYLGLRELPALRYVARTYEGPLASLAEAVRENVAAVRIALANTGALAAARAPIAVYLRTNIRLRTTACHIGIEVDHAKCDGLPVRRIPAHRAYLVRLTGNPAALELAWYQGMQRLRAEGLLPDPSIPPRERYVGACMVEPGAPQVIDLYLPVRAA